MRCGLPRQRRSDETATRPNSSCATRSPRCAVGTVVNLPEGAGTTTIESKTNFVGPAPVGVTVIGETTPIHRGRRTMVWQTRITTAEGKLVAVVTQTQMVL